MTFLEIIKISKVADVLKVYKKTSLLNYLCPILKKYEHKILNNISAYKFLKLTKTLECSFKPSVNFLFNSKSKQIEKMNKGLESNNLKIFYSSFLYLMLTGKIKNVDNLCKRLTIWIPKTGNPTFVPKKLVSLIYLKI